jgi:hypothetical protein
MSKFYYAGILSAAILSVALPDQSHATFKKVFGITSTTDYLNQMIALTQMQDTLKQINDVNAKVTEEEKKINVMNQLIDVELRSSIKEAQDKLDKLAETVLKDSELRSKDIQSRIASREGNAEELQKGLNSESQLSKWAKAINFLSAGVAKPAVNYAQKMDAAAQKAIEDQIAARRKSIADLQRQLADEQKALKNVFTSPEYQQQAQALNKLITGYTDALVRIEAGLQKKRQENIFNPYNKQAQDLLKQLNTQIKDAKCDQIKTMADTKEAIISQCKQQKLDAAKKATTDKFPACQSLTITSTVDQINQCITYYRANR